MTMKLCLNFLEFDQMWWGCAEYGRFLYLQGSFLHSLLIQRIAEEKKKKKVLFLAKIL